MSRLLQCVRWPLIVLPAVLVGGFEYCRHALFEGVPDQVGNLTAAAIAVVGSFIYYLYTVTTIERLTASLHEEKARKAIMDERERIAGQLHDSVAQTLFFLNAQLDRAVTALQDGNPSDALPPIADAKKGVSFAHQDLRKTIAALHETDWDKPLIPGLKEMVTSFYRQSGIDVDLAPAAHLPNVPSDVRYAIFRLVQEALNNIRKHAQAERATVRIGSSNEGLCVTIEDDGVGFEPDHAEKGFGLSEMERLARGVDGSLQIESLVDGGTRVRVVAPSVRFSSPAGRPRSVPAKEVPL